ncbi:hypothetical protein Tco_1365141 [Tanacetum coccineum]
MKDLGAARKILGMEIIRDRKQGKLFLSQKSNIEKIISHFGMSLEKSVNTPSSTNFCLSTTSAPQTESEIQYMSRIPYASAVGSLMYVMVCTRQDIVHAMSVVSRYIAHPVKQHWNEVKCIFHYLKGTSFDVGLIYGGDHEYLVAGYLNSDYAADLDARRSLTGYVFTIGNSVVSWKATLQPSVTLSTTEAEYMALTQAAKEAGLLELFAAGIAFGVGLGLAAGLAEHALALGLAAGFFFVIANVTVFDDGLALQPAYS